MKRTFLLLALVFAIGTAQAQNTNKANNPNERSNVTKEYDEQGNLIRYDSTYVKSWSSGDSTLNPADLEAIQKQMEQVFSGSFFGGPASGGSLFEDGFGGGFFSQFGFQPGDSTQLDMPGFQNSFPGFEEMHQRMMSQFRNFFQTDSIPFGNDSVFQQFHFFGTPEELEKMQQELEKQQEQLDKKSSKK